MNAAASWRSVASSWLAAIGQQTIDSRQGPTEAHEWQTGDSDQYQLVGAKFHIERESSDSSTRTKDIIIKIKRLTIKVDHLPSCIPRRSLTNLGSRESPLQRKTPLQMWQRPKLSGLEWKSPLVGWESLLGSWMGSLMEDSWMGLLMVSLMDSLRAVLQSRRGGVQE